MDSLEVATWNVLHRIHAENWGEEPARRFPDECVRIAAIAERIAALLERGARVIALQEVSGDQLARLRAALPPSAQVLTLRYPRVPKHRIGAIAHTALHDPTEHLVTVVAAGAGARELAASAFHDDHGKGFLAIELEDGTTLVNAHITYGDKRPGQLGRIADLADERTGAVLLLGDFNADAATVATTLGSPFSFAVPTQPSLPTRPRTSGSKSQTIDHILTLRAASTACTVLDAAGLSDHNPVTATIHLPER